MHARVSNDCKLLSRESFAHYLVLRVVGSKRFLQNIYINSHKTLKIACLHIKSEFGGRHDDWCMDH